MATCRRCAGSLRGLRKEGFRYQYHLQTEAEANAATVERQRLRTDKRDEHGPFDIIGDVHGCFDELAALLGRLGYRIKRAAGEDGHRFHVSHPDGRRLVFPRRSWWTAAPTCPTACVSPWTQ